MNEQISSRRVEIRLRSHDLDRLIERIETGPITMTYATRGRAESRTVGIGDLIAANLKDVVATKDPAVFEFTLTRSDADASRLPPVVSPTSPVRNHVTEEAPQ